MGLGGPAVLQQHTEVQVQYICLPSLGMVSAGVGTVSLAPTHTIPVPNPNWLSALNDKKGQKAQSLDKEVKMRDMRTTTLTNLGTRPRKSTQECFPVHLVGCLGRVPHVQIDCQSCVVVNTERRLFTKRISKALQCLGGHPKGWIV